MPIEIEKRWIAELNEGNIYLSYSDEKIISDWKQEVDPWDHLHAEAISKLEKTGKEICFTRNDISCGKLRSEYFYML